MLAFKRKEVLGLQQKLLFSFNCSLLIILHYVEWSSVSNYKTSSSIMYKVKASSINILYN